MIWVILGPAWGCCFHLYKGLLVTYELFAKMKKNSLKIAFSDFLKEFVCDEQSFIEVKQHPQAGPETTHTMCEKFENFWKNRIFEFFLTIFHGPPHMG